MCVSNSRSRYRPGVAQRVGRGIALLFHERGTRRGWVVSSTPRPHFTPGKDPVPILQEAGWATGPVWTGGKSCPHRDSIPDRPARSQSLYRLSCLAQHTHTHTYTHIPNILTINRNNFSKKHLPFDLFNWFNFNWSWTRELYLILVLHLPRHTAIAAVLRDTIKGTLHIIVANLTANNCDVAN